MGKSKASRTIGIIVAILVCIIVAVVLIEVFMQHPEELSYDEFFNRLKKGEIKSVYLEGNYKMNVLYVGTSSKSISNNPDAYVYVPNRSDPIEKIYAEAPADAVPAIVMNDPSKNSIWASLIPIVVGPSALPEVLHFIG